MSQEIETIDMIILTKSKKYNNLCVAGIDVNSGEWIRLVSEDTEIKYAIKPQDLIYKNKREANILDKVSVVIKNGEAPWYHPENKILDLKYYLDYIDSVNSVDLVEFIDSEKEYIFFNEKNKISKEKLEEIDNIYSLILIDVGKIYIHRSSYDANRIFANFRYNNIWYKYIRITDIEFLDRYDELIPEEGQYILNNVKLVLSLGEEYEGSYYKLIASIIE